MSTEPPGCGWFGSLCLNLIVKRFVYCSAAESQIQRCPGHNSRLSRCVCSYPRILRALLAHESLSTLANCCSHSSCWSQSPSSTSLSLFGLTLSLPLSRSLTRVPSQMLWEPRLVFSELFGDLFLIPETERREREREEQDIFSRSIAARCRWKELSAVTSGIRHRRRRWSTLWPKSRGGSHESHPLSVSWWELLSNVGDFQQHHKPWEEEQSKREEKQNRINISGWGSRNPAVPFLSVADGIPGCQTTDLGIIPVPLQEEAGCRLWTCDPLSGVLGVVARDQRSEGSRGGGCFAVLDFSAQLYELWPSPWRQAPWTPNSELEHQCERWREAWRPDGCPCCCCWRCLQRCRVAWARRETSQGSTRGPGGGRVTGAVSNPLLNS